MQLSLHVSSLLVFIGLTLAAPVNFDENSLYAANFTAREMSTLYRRGDTPICGYPLRDSKVEAKCKQSPFQWTWDGKELKSVATKGDPVDKTAQCDHSFELQVLARTMEQNGGCSALRKIYEAAGLGNSNNIHEFLGDVLDPLVDAANDQTNLFWLPHDINNKKKDVVKAFLNNNPHPAHSPEIDAVHTYYQNPTIRANTAALAAKLDTLMHEALATKAKQSHYITAALQTMGGKTSSRRGGALAEAAQKKIDAAVKAWVDENPANAQNGIAHRWTQFLAWV